jgi:hypothetical protein
MLATSGNIIGAAKERRGAKLAKDRITIGIFFNATGSDFWKPAIIGTAKKPRCFGNHWTPEKAGALYYHNDSAWMRGEIWLDMINKFNAYCYDKRPVVLLVDNCPAHKPPIGATMWQNGHMQGYKLSNVLIIYFEPNCTSHVQPLDAGCIQTAKALYRKRQMTWVLRQISQSTPAGKPQIKCNIRQAIEWFISSLHSIPAGNSLFQITLRHYVVDDHAMYC